MYKLFLQKISDLFGKNDLPFEGDLLSSLPEYDNHRFVSTIIDQDSQLLAFVSIHRGGLTTPTFGATRLWPYSSPLFALKDSLKLSKIMSYKSALAGFPYGGAKAVILQPKEIKNKTALLRTYAQRVNYLKGAFITGADVGINSDDMKVMINESQYFVGRSVDPIEFTTQGVVLGIEVCLKEVFGSKSFANRSFSIQGLGKTGMGVLKKIYKEAVKVYVCDLSDEKLQEAKNLGSNINIVDLSEIHSQETDVFIPCALSDAINKKNISEIKSKIIAGSANSQLESDILGDNLSNKGILYAPDYVINAGGLMAVVDEYQNIIHDDYRISQKVLSIETTLQKIIDESKKKKQPTHRVANQMAETIFNSLK